MANSYTVVQCQAVTEDVGTSLTGKPLIQEWFFQRVSGSNVPTKSAIDTAFQAWLVANVMSNLSVKVQQTKNLVRWVEDPSDLALETAHAVAGSISGEALPTFNAMVWRFGSGFRGGQYRGSKHLGLVPESFVTGDQLNSTATTALASIKAATLAGFTEAGGSVYVPTVLSRTYSVSPLGTGTLFYNRAITLDFTLTIGTMKGRKYKRAG